MMPSLFQARIIHIIDIIKQYQPTKSEMTDIYELLEKKKPLYMISTIDELRNTLLIKTKFVSVDNC